MESQLCNNCLITQALQDSNWHVYFWGKRFHVYEVIRRTASRLRVKKIRNYTVYSTNGPLRHIFDVKRAAGVYTWDLVDRDLVETLKPVIDSSAEELKVLTGMYKVVDVGKKLVKYDADNKKLVVVERV